MHPCDWTFTITEVIVNLSFIDFVPLFWDHRQLLYFDVHEKILHLHNEVCILGKFHLDHLELFEHLKDTHCTLTYLEIEVFTCKRTDESIKTKCSLEISYFICGILFLFLFTFTFQHVQIRRALYCMIFQFMGRHLKTWNEYQYTTIEFHFL